MSHKNEPAQSQFRLALLAQLAIQRARFLHGLIGMDSERLQQAIWDDYSPHRLLPHIALWDGFEAERLSLLRDGKLDQLGWMPVDERNAAWHKAHAQTTLDAGIAMLQKERQGLLNVLASVPDELLKATVTLSESFELPVLSCISSSIEHDETHADQITAWKQANEWTRWQNGPKVVLLAAMKANRRALKALRALINSAETPKKGPLQIGDWSFHDTLAHLLGWEKNLLASLQIAQSVNLGQNYDDLNKQFVQQASETTPDVLWTEYEAAHRATEQWVERQDEDVLLQPFQSGANDINTLTLWLTMYVDHNAEHIQEIYSAYLMYMRFRR